MKIVEKVRFKPWRMIVGVTLVVFGFLLGVNHVYGSIVLVLGLLFVTSTIGSNGVSNKLK